MALNILPKEFHIDFRLPGVKPVGPVEIDYSNPLARKLKGVISEGFRALPSPLGGGVIKVTPRGKGLAAIDSPDHTDTWRYDGIEVSREPKHSVFIHFHQPIFPSPAATGEAIYCERPNSTQIFKIVLTSKFLDNGDMSWVTRNSAGGGLQERIVSAALDQSIDFHSIMFVKNSDTDRVLYADENIATSANDSGGTYNATNTSICADPFDIGAANHNQTVLVVYAFKEALSAKDYRSLQADPYQLLKPKTPAMYFTAAGAPPAGRIMSSLANNGGLAGLGGIAGPGGGLAG